MERIVHDVGAFANTHGGWVIVGIADDGEVVGVDDFQKAEAAIIQAVTSRTFPALRPRIFAVSNEGRELLVVEVSPWEGVEPLRIRPKGKDDWVVYERIGSVSQRVDDPARVERMRAERRGSNTLDQLTAEADMDALDLELVVEKFENVGLGVDDALLQSAGLARSINGTMQPTNAGLLLFGVDPQAIFQDAYMRCGRYRTDRKTTRIASADLEHQPLLRVIEEAEAFIEQQTGEIETGLHGLQQVTIPWYSERVVRELLVNAVAHADYAHPGTPFALQVFRDRLEITSPGRFPAGMTAEQVRSGVSQPRNRGLITALHRLRYAEQTGSAWDKAVDEETRYGYPTPVWRELGAQVRVVVPVHPVARDVASTVLDGRSPDEVSSAVGAGGGPHAEVETREGEGVAPRARKSPAARRQEILDFVADDERSSVEIAKALNLTSRQIRRYIGELERSGSVRHNGEPETSPHRRYRRAR